MGCSMDTRKDPGLSEQTLEEWIDDMCTGTLEVQPDEFIRIWDRRDWANAFAVHEQVKRAHREGLADLLSYVTADHVPGWVRDQLDGQLAFPQEDSPGPELFDYTGSLNWFALADDRPGQVDLSVQYERSPELERIREVAAGARAMGADVRYFAQLITDATTEGIEVHLEALAVGTRVGSRHPMSAVRQRIVDDFGVVLLQDPSPVGFSRGYQSWEWF